jgi:hypothetical protein
MLRIPHRLDTRLIDGGKFVMEGVITQEASVWIFAVMRHQTQRRSDQQSGELLGFFSVCKIISGLEL